MRVTVERLRSEEWPRWRAIRLRSLRDSPDAFSTKLADVVTWDDQRWIGQVLQFATFVAVLDGCDVGVARGAAHARDDTRQLISLWVAPEARRHGVGALLIDNVAAWGRASGAETLTLDVAANNEAAIALYEAARFVRCIDDSYGQPDPTELRFVRSLR